MSEVKSTWNDEELPILRAVFLGERDKSGGTVWQRLEALGLEQDVVLRALKALIDDGQVAGANVHMPPAEPVKGWLPVFLRFLCGWLAC